MQTKLLALMFVVVVLSSSFAGSVLPKASALTARTDFSNRHTTATLGNSRVCGDHVCAPGEKTQWANNMAGLQRVGAGKIGNATNYEQALQHLKSTLPSTSTHKITESEHLKIGSSTTKSENSASKK